MRALLVFLAVLLAAPLGRATEALPLVVPTQGRLLDASDQPVNGTLDITFAIYDAEVDTPANPVPPLWTGKYSVTVSNGFYDVDLGDPRGTLSGPLSAALFQNQSQLWLGITIGTGSELSPRLRLGAVPYAYLAGQAVDADHATLADNVPDGAIATAKLADQAVASQKIADGAVTTGQLAAGAVTATQLADQAVSTPKLADGSVTLQKLALTNGKFVGLDADTLDGLDSSAFAPADIETTVDAIKTSTDLLPGIATTLGNGSSGLVADVATIQASTAALGPQVASVLNDAQTLETTVGTPASSSLAGDVAALSAKVDVLSSQVTTLTSTLTTVTDRQTFDDNCDDSGHGGWPSKTACLADGRWHTVFLGTLTAAGVSTPNEVCSFILQTLQQLAVAPENATTSGPQGAYWEVRFGYDSSNTPFHGEWHTQDAVNLDLFDSANNLVEWTDNYSVGSCSIPAPASYGWEAFIAVRK